MSGQPVRLARKVTSARLERPDLKAFKGKPVQPDLLVRRGRPAQRELKACRAMLVRQAQRVRKVKQA